MDSQVRLKIQQMYSSSYVADATKNLVERCEVRIYRRCGESAARSEVELPLGLHALELGLLARDPLLDGRVHGLLLPRLDFLQDLAGCYALQYNRKVLSAKTFWGYGNSEGYAKSFAWWVRKPRGYVCSGT